MRDRSGRIIGASKIARDISERSRRSDEAYRLAAIVSSSDDAIVSKDLNGIVRSWNPAAERLFGYSEAEMIGRSIRTIIPDEHQHEEDEVLRRIRNGDRVEHFETVRQRKDGSLVQVSITVSPVRDENGLVIGASKIARDISERKAVEAALLSSLQMKDQFLGLVSHELRTPISTIVGNGQLLLRRMDRLSNADRSQALSDVVTEGQRLQRIIENLLLLTRLGATEALPREPMDLAQVVRQAASDIRRRSPYRSVSVTVDGHVSIVAGDPTLTALVIQNLIGNADKYSPGDSLIEVVVSQDVEDRPKVHVLDRGIGIDEENRTLVFEAFFRSSLAKEKAGGMGLGLAVCRKIVEAQGGTIGVDPRPAGGSDFWFSMPAYWTAQENSASKPRILLVDDDAALVRMVKLALSTEGFDVEEAHNGIEGLRCLEESRFDLVVLDVQMPLMNGREMFRELRQRGYVLPVLIVSAYGAQSTSDELNADGALSKPFDSDDLIAVVQALLDKRPIAI